MYERGEIMTEHERLDILQWVCDNFFENDIVRGYTKLKYSLSVFNKTIPTAIWRIKNRIMHEENVRDYMPMPIFTDLILINTTGGSTPAHMDPNIEGYTQIRYNVGILMPKTGSKTVYNGRAVNIKNRHYALCRSGIDIHSVDINTSDHPRIMLSYSFCVPSSNVKDDIILASPKDNIVKIGNVYYNRDPLNTNLWPSPITTLNFIVSKAYIYGLNWWVTNRLGNDMTVREYIDS